MNKTTIEYVDYTWNPITGCLGPGGTPEEPRRCPYCYAHRLAKGRLKARYLGNRQGFMQTTGCTMEWYWDPFWPKIWTERLNQPLRRRKPAKIFVVDMGDLFHEEVSGYWIESVLIRVRQASQHTYLFLTKNPARYKEFEPWPDNCWLGTTVTNQQDWNERWPEMRKVRAKKWVSFEPLLGRILAETANFETSHHGVYDAVPAWVVIGAQTGMSAVSPNGDWVRNITDWCDFLDVPVFHKDNLDCEGLGIERRREWPR